jgi:hypothetical protein
MSSSSWAAAPCSIRLKRAVIAEGFWSVAFAETVRSKNKLKKRTAKRPGGHGTSLDGVTI